MSSSTHWRIGGEQHLIAHRGASKYARENSPEAIEEAARRGATDVEIDVNMTVDGVLLAIHNSSLGDGVPRWISMATADEVAGSIDHPVATLDQVLDVVSDSGLGLYLDVKQLLPGGAEMLGELLRSRGLIDRTVGSSFRSDLALAMKRDGGLTTSVLFHDPDLDINSLVRGTGADFVHPCYDVFPDPLRVLASEWVDEVKALGCGVITWNTLDVDVAASVYGMGVDGACSDDPSVLVDAQRKLNK